MELMDENQLEKLVETLVEKNLIAVYAYGNLQRAMLRFLLVDIIAQQSDDRARTLQEYYGSIRQHLQTAKFPASPHNEQIRLESLRLAQECFRDFESGFELAGIKLERKLIL